MGRVSAVLFDIDGTLVDSNFLHVDAWSSAFGDLGLHVPSWRIQRAIGADGAELLEQLVPGESAETKSTASDLHSQHYAELMPRLRVLPGARELMSAIAGRGARVVLATSAPQNELERLLDVLDVGDLVHAVTSGDDVGTSKPEPDIIDIALERGGVAPRDTLMVGDAMWDVRAARRAHVDTVALRSGGTGEAELLQAGAIAVYDDAASLLDDIDDGPLGRLWS